MRDALAWIKERWRAALAWIGIGAAVVFGAIVYALGRGPKPDPLAEARANSDVLRERAKAKEREAEIIGERRTEIEHSIATSETESTKARDKIQGESMDELAERWNR